MNVTISFIFALFEDWDNPLGMKTLKVAAVALHLNEEHLMAEAKNVPHRRSRIRCYKFLDVGRMKDLPCSDQSDDCLSVALRIAGGSRVLSFADSSWHFEQSELGRLRRGGNWKNVLVDVSIAGFVFSLSDYYPREVLSITVKAISVSKPTGQVETKSRVCLIQIDAMLGSARYPIMLAPVKNFDSMIRASLHIDADHRKLEVLEPMQSTWSAPKPLNELELLPLLRTYWDEQNEEPIPFFEATISYLPQPSMLWIPEVVITFCPLKIQVDVAYVLRIVNLFLNSFPESDEDHHLQDVSALLEQLNSPLQIPQLLKEHSAPSYFERVHVNETHVELDLDLRPENSMFDASYDPEDSLISLTSMGRVAKSAISASLLSWVNIASTAFSKISPKFKFSGFVRNDCYSEVDELINSIISFYSKSLVKQSYKVRFKRYHFQTNIKFVFLLFS